MRILKDRTIALIIDFQEKIFPVIHDKDILLKNVPILIEGLKIMEIPIFITEQYVKGLGPTIPEIAKTIEGFERIEKSSFSCCDEPKLMLQLAALGKENVIIAGIESHVCVLQTVTDLIRNGFHPVVVEDCVSSRKESDKRAALNRMQREGAIVTTFESILFELLRYSGTEQFKAISRLVK
jgi:hypothetical protein